MPLTGSLGRSDSRLGNLRLSGADVGLDSTPKYLGGTVTIDFNVSAEPEVMKYLGGTVTIDLNVSAEPEVKKYLGGTVTILIRPQAVLSIPETPVVAITRPTYMLEIAGLGGSLAAWTDVTDYLRLFKYERGRSQDVGGTVAGTAHFELADDDGIFDSQNAASPYFPNVRNGLPVRFKMILDGEDYYRFTGYLDHWEGEPSVLDANVACPCVDGFSRLSLVNLGQDHFALPTVILAEDNQAINTRIDALLDLIGWPEPKRVLGQTQYTAGTLEELDVPWLQVVDWYAQLERATVFLDGAGNFCFQTVFDRLLKSSRGTFGAGGLPIVPYPKVGLAGSIYNRVVIGRPQQSDTVLMVEDGDSQQLHGRQQFSLDSRVGDEFQSDRQARDWAQWLLQGYAWPFEHVSEIGLDPYAGAYEVQLWWYLCTLELGDRLTITHNLPGSMGVVGEDSHVDRLSHEIVFKEGGDPIHTFTLGLSPRKHVATR